MLHGRRVAPLPIDLSNVSRRRSVTSLFSNLVTRPTGRAIRSGVESQLAAVEGEHQVIVSILDFTQVRVLDYSCADEIVAKLLLRYLGAERPAEAYFVVRNVQEHHVEAIEAVLERHDLLVVAVCDGGDPELLGSDGADCRRLWEALVRRGRASRSDLALDTGLPREEVTSVLTRLLAQRVVAVHVDGSVSPLTALLHTSP
jgi:hypothetical protein